MVLFLLVFAETVFPSNFFVNNLDESIYSGSSNRGILCVFQLAREGLDPVVVYYQGCLFSLCNHGGSLLGPIRVFRSLGCMPQDSKFVYGKDNLNLLFPFLGWETHNASVGDPRTIFMS